MAFAKVGNDLQNTGIVVGAGGGLVTAFAPEAGVGEIAVESGVAIYSIGSSLKDSVSIYSLVFNSGNGSGFILGQVNNFVLSGIPEGLGRTIAEDALDKAEEKAGLDKGDPGGCGGN